MDLWRLLAYKVEKSKLNCKSNTQETRFLETLQVQTSCCEREEDALDIAAKWVRMLGGFRAFKERLVIPEWMKFAEERTEHRFTLFGTDIDVIRPEKFFNGVCSYGKIWRVSRIILDIVQLKLI